MDKRGVDAVYAEFRPYMIDGSWQAAAFDGLHDAATAQPKASLGELRKALERAIEIAESQGGPDEEDIEELENLRALLDYVPECKECGGRGYRGANSLDMLREPCEACGASGGSPYSTEALWLSESLRQMAQSRKVQGAGAICVMCGKTWGGYHKLKCWVPDLMRAADMLAHNTTPEIRGHLEGEVSDCARCGGTHPIVWKRLARPSGEYTHWGACSVTSEPVLMMIVEEL